MACFSVHCALFCVLTPCSLEGGYKSLSSLSSHTDVADVSGFLERFAMLTGKQLLNLMIDLEDKVTTFHQNIS